LNDLASEHDCEWIFTGHTLDDQAETVLLATLRGSGLNGLAGIPARRGAIVRPLLEVRRHETREFCLVLGWAPVEDPMNLDPAFTRVWLRREVLPALERGMDRDLAVVLARQADIARADAEVLDALATALLDECVPGLPGAGLAVDRLLRAPQAIARRALRRWLPVAVGSEAIDSLLGVAAGGGRAVDIGSGRRVRRSAGHLIIELVSASTVGSVRAVVLSVPGTAQFGELLIRTRVDAVPPIAWPDGRAACVLDADVVGEEVVVRSPASGERFRPLGLAGTKTVAAARADAGITVDLRHDLPVVARVDGEIVWVLGYRGAHPARVTSSTRRYCWMTVEPASEGPL
jgi:tRNA(Ile)-lysidine synthase